MKKTRIVTMINMQSPKYSHVCELRGEGPRNYRIAVINAYDGSINRERLEPKADHIRVIEGDHRALVKTLHQMDRDIDEKTRKWGSDRQRAIWEFRSQWDHEHPMPGFPPMDEFINEYMRGKA